MYKTKNMVMAALLTAISIIITFSPFKLPMPAPFSVTLGSHVPTMIAIFINPWVTLFTVLGSCLGFWISTGNIVIVLRSASHIVFALLGAYMIKNKSINIFITIVVTSLAHALLEGALVYAITPFIFPDKATIAYTLAITATIGTVFHHFVDAAITAPILFSLTKARLINTNIFSK